MHAESAVISTEFSASVTAGTSVPPLTHVEAGRMAAEETRRFLDLIESLSEADWDRPTACDRWTVQDIVAHQAAHVVSFTSLKAFFGQLKPSLLRPYLRQGMNLLDALNQSQVDLRARAAPADLIAEIRAAKDQSLAARARIPVWVRGPALPMPGVDQPRSLGYLFDLIYTRDMWMHRLDICRATGRAMVIDDEYDRRTVALVVRDLALKAQHGLAGRSAILDLTGSAGEVYQIGAVSNPSARVEIDAIPFCILTSGRTTAADVLAADVVIRGDRAFGEEVIRYCENRVLY